MMRSMYTATAGLLNHQTRMDVIGNNIANVNTVAFKTGRATFQDILSQTIAGARSPRNDWGGINPKQVGLGVKLGAIDTIFNQGSLQLTNNPTDFAIEGAGFFIVQDGDEQYYTRDGSFKISPFGDDQDAVSLVTADGLRVMGWVANDDGEIDTEGPLENIVVPNTIDNPDDPENPLVLEALTTSSDGTISGVYSDGETRLLAQTGLASFVNPGGLHKAGDNLYRTSANSGDVSIGAPNTGGRGSVQVGMLEMSNVDITQEFTNMITTQRGFQANSRTITTSDEMLQEAMAMKR